MSDDVNEIRPELVSIHALNAGTLYNAPARSNMFASHFGQRPIIKDSEPILIQTGVADEFGKYTLNVAMPEDGTILQIFDLYPSGFGEESFNFNPESIIVYQKHSDGEIDYFTVPYHYSLHPNFGFPYTEKQPMRDLAVGRSFKKDTVFLDSPAVKGEHHYTWGRNVNIAYMAHSNVGLDGYVVSDTLLKAYEFSFYETRSIEIGTSEFPLNVNGDDDHYRPFPEIGSYIREDGLLMAVRKLNPALAPAMLSKKDTQEVNYHFDTRVFVRPGKGRVVGLTVIKSDNVNRQLPEPMTAQLERYSEAYKLFHRDIVRFEQKLINENKRNGGNGRINISRALQRLFVKSKAIINHPFTHQQGGTPGLTLVYRKEPLNTWRVNVTIEYSVTPERGFKFSCVSGGKGVVVRVEKEENMPIDADGNRAHIISGPDSIPGRMNLNRLYEPYFNGAARDIFKECLSMMGLDREFRGPITPEELMQLPKSGWNNAMSHLLKFYKIVSERMYQEFTEVLTEAEQYAWIAEIINTGHNLLYIPIETQKRWDEMVLEIEQNFKLVYGPVTYVNRAGQKVTTKNNVRIAPLYIMLLDKIADSWLAASIGKHNNFGILAAMNEADKHNTPWRTTPARVFGETESRLYCMYGGRTMIAELLDRSGSIRTQEEMADQIIHSEAPFKEQNLVDRQKIPFGEARSNQIAKSIFYTAGIKLSYSDEETD